MGPTALTRPSSALVSGFALRPVRRCSRLVVLRRPGGVRLSTRVTRLGGWITFPRDPTGACPARRHSCVEPGELDRLPSCLTARHPPFPCCWARRLATLQGTQRVALGLPGTRGARPGGDPGPFDRCLLLTDSVLKELFGMMPKSRCTPQRSSHALWELSVSRRRAHFGEPTRGPERCLLRLPSCRRPSDTSSPHGLSRRNYVHRHRPAVVRSRAATSGRPEGLGRLHQAA
jgi:hypothetical protein